MSKKWYKEFETKLASMKTEIARANSQQQAHGAEIDLAHGDDIDQAESNYEQEMSYVFRNRGIEELKLIDDALDRIQKGSYGVCESCGEEITVKRLKAQPFVRYCIACQEQSEQKSKKR